MDHTLAAGDGISHYRIVGATTGPRCSLDSKSVGFVYGTSSKDVVLITDFQ